MAIALVMVWLNTSRWTAARQLRLRKHRIVHVTVPLSAVSLTHCDYSRKTKDPLGQTKKLRHSHWHRHRRHRQRQSGKLCSWFRKGGRTSKHKHRSQRTFAGIPTQNGRGWHTSTSSSDKHVYSAHRRRDIQQPSAVHGVLIAVSQAEFSCDLFRRRLRQCFPVASHRLKCQVVALLSKRTRMQSHIPQVGADTAASVYFQCPPPSPRSRPCALPEISDALLFGTAAGVNDVSTSNPLDIDFNLNLEDTSMCDMEADYAHEPLSVTPDITMEEIEASVRVDKYPLLFPNMKAKPSTLPACTDPTTYLQIVKRNILAEYTAFLQEARPSQRLFIAFPPSLVFKVIGEVRLHPDPTTKVEELQAYHKHLVLIKDNLCITIYKATYDYDAYGNRIRLRKEELIYVIGDDWRRLVCEGAFQVLNNRLPTLNDDVMLDFGYVGTFIEDLTAHDSLLQKVLDVDVGPPPLLIALADPRLRTQISRKPNALSSSTPSDVHTPTLTHTPARTSTPALTPVSTSTLAATTISTNTRTHTPRPTPAPAPTPIPAPTPAPIPSTRGATTAMLAVVTARTTPPTPAIKTNTGGTPTKEQQKHVAMAIRSSNGGGSGIENEQTKPTQKSSSTTTSSSSSKSGLTPTTSSSSTSAESLHGFRPTQSNETSSMPRPSTSKSLSIATPTLTSTTTLATPTSTPTLATTAPTPTPTPASTPTTSSTTLRQSGDVDDGVEDVPMNKEQQHIVQSLKYQIECIQGPPGTGKSSTIYHIIRQRLGINEIALATCVQNKAVDAIAEKFADRIPFIVLGNADNLGLTAKHWTLDEQINRVTTIAHHTAHAIQLKGGLQQCEAMLAQQQQQTYCGSIFCIDPDLYETKSKIEDEIKATTKQGLELRMLERENLLDRVRAVLCTVATTASVARVLGPARAKRVRTAILDEAGTTPESRMLTLLSLPSLDRIIATGDQKQLAPFSHIKLTGVGICSDFQRGECYNSVCKLEHVTNTIKGFFTRVEEALGSGAIPVLTQQYRMHPNLCTMVSKLFYNRKLTTPKAIASKRCAVDKQGLWAITTAGEESAPFPNSFSLANVDEIETIFTGLQKIGSRLEAEGTVMIITFYTAQRTLLRKRFATLNIQETDQFRICTVDESQGSEADTVILSTVRSNNLRQVGFLSNPNRINVAISRARNRLVIVGNDDTLSKDANWYEILQACKLRPFIHEVFF